MVLLKLQNYMDQYLHLLLLFYQSVFVKRLYKFREILKAS